MTRIGVVLRPELAPEDLVDAARAADRAGVDEVWLWEDCFYSGGLSAAALVLANTEHVSVGIGVLPTPMRNVAATAMEIATVARVHPGRLRVGLGHGVQSWMGQIGARVQSPLTLLTEQMTALTALLAGESVSVQGRYVSLDNVQLNWPPLQPPPLLVGATGPKTLALSGRTGVGTILTSETSSDQVRAAIEHIDGGPDHEIVVYIAAATDSDAALSNLQRWIDAGATTVVLEPPADRTDPTTLFTHAAALTAQVSSP
ncbi:LLM class flavin-dependent oxidoreductase [Rhodococcus sp. 15-725-2-2b]|uniref:LLM class flavin-dependent oxidoreductase n=1 Tax=unclassified Rhodococcus (in: high G+C Gram-positive bacteria) TaxID=192944 RepID=UPI000B9B4BD9|nr:MULTISPECIES: LLM class flavin-dependent oxidoreductase [unclassified Rhodococcus (in: high G+C Gram-positive bacteria)]OZC68549.1 LLM class flavin-dependent oxidoreductase [Rhodococcus sp. 06-469-3-2]OZD45226.1 LLM class flavin-dependent oxidoreductase [Rhodococcus sp. 06-1477-1A]OZE73103.1 LLM class flavin-dependent oxidoreductase [Rhodococcus sp. 15-725-2-2b]